MTLKTCACCGRTYTLAQWLATPSLGVCDEHMWGGFRFRLDVRNCVCGSTMAVEVALVCDEWLHLDESDSAAKEAYSR